MVGSGTLITFPTLLAFGVPPVTANVSNTIGLVPGSLSGAIGYRARARRAARAGCCGWARPRCSAASIGAVLLLSLPSAAFDAIVPVLIAPRRCCSWSPARDLAPGRRAAREARGGAEHGALVGVAGDLR